ncbi:MAG: hypothetical protein U9Q39_04900, partial [Pseudomonadota bacterium]|nr:hypothetical protein [Pseudomonadota bacterium]
GAGRQRHFAPDLGHWLPTRIFDRRSDEEIADIDFAEVLLIDCVQKESLFTTVDSSGCDITVILREAVR